MIALSEYLRNHGYDASHTRIRGIWTKLRTLYNLEVLDERDNDFEYDPAIKDNWKPFSLDMDFENNWREYAEEMFMRGERKSSDSESSPNRSPSPQANRTRRRGNTITVKTRSGTADDGDDVSQARSSPPPPIKASRTVRSNNKSTGRVGDTPKSRQSVEEESAVEEAEAESEEQEEGEEDEKATPKASKGKAKGPTRKSGRNK
jgi:MRG-binding protein